jgi:hypothetical protein
VTVGWQVSTLKPLKHKHFDKIDIQVNEAMVFVLRDQRFVNFNPVGFAPP